MNSANNLSWSGVTKSPFSSKSGYFSVSGYILKLFGLALLQVKMSISIHPRTWNQKARKSNPFAFLTNVFNFSFVCLS